MINYQIIIVLVVIILILISLYLNKIGIALTFFLGNLIFGLTGILKPEEILAGLANQQVIVIIMLLALGEVIRRTSVIEIVFSALFKRAKSYNIFILQLMLLVAIFSIFLNNTPIVAVMLPFVIAWGKQHKVSVSLLLIPLSFAAILGGTSSLIGTSTNLIVNGMVMDQNIIPNLPQIDLFDFAPVGLTMTGIGILYFLIFGKKLLRDRHSVRTDKIVEQDKMFYLEAEIRMGSKLIDKTIEEANFDEKRGIKLIEIRRNDETFKDPEKTFTLQLGDKLYFTGISSEIAEISDDISGLSFPQVGLLHKQRQKEITEIVISHNSSLINKTFDEIRFRSRFDSAPIAIHRNGESFFGKISDIKLKAGDLILLLSGKNFPRLSNETNDFYVLSKVREMIKFPAWKVGILFGGLAGAIAISATGYASLFILLALLMAILVIIGMISPKDIHKRVDFNLYMIIALSLSLGTAVMKTGTADFIANFFDTIAPFGPIGLMIAIYFVTALLAAYITNQGAVALIFPIALTLALNHGFDPKPFILIVAYAAAANFMTPIGYQTNIMVYGPGNYSFKDFFRVGFPLTIIYMFVAVTILYQIYFK